MRSVDPDVQLKEHTTSTNVLELVSVISEDKLAINEKEKADLFINPEKNFDVQYSTISEFDNAL
jgi:hypothetical protein